MTWRVLLENRARAEFLRLPRNVRDRLEEALERLTSDPRPPGAKRLVGRDGYRLRKGDYRILYVVDDRERIVRVYRLGHRREVYR
ncbi:MAG: type II toxin-antitoxin system RelE/ParE family toxin [Myxococcota bacterium]|nr:type II toxin-antitoxin system RelE/ParE family toxin [Myxococcota bacterium]